MADADSSRAHGDGEEPSRKKQRTQAPGNGAGTAASQEGAGAAAAPAGRCPVHHQAASLNVGGAGTVSDFTPPAYPDRSGRGGEDFPSCTTPTSSWTKYLGPR